MEVGRIEAGRQLRRLAEELDLFPAFDIADKVTAALDATPTMNGHDAVPPPKGPDDYGTTSASAPATTDNTTAIVPATFITPAAWPNEAPPPVDWLVTGRIPRGDVTSTTRRRRSG